MSTKRTGHTNSSERILGIPVSLLSLNTLTDKALLALDTAGAPFTVAFANPHSIVVSRRDEVFRRALESASVVAPDGTGIVIASALHGRGIRKRITGFDFFEGFSRILNERGGRRCFFLGSSRKTLDRLQVRFEKLYPSITFAGSYSPPYREKFSKEETAAMVAAVNAAKADVLWISLTAPKQEKWMHLNAASMDVKVIGAIGAVFDYFAGNIRRPGKLWRACGLEWFPRLLQEPRRLWRRNFVSSLHFMYLTTMERNRRHAGYRQSFPEREIDLPESPFALLGRMEEETARQRLNDSMTREDRKESLLTKDNF
ncbi:MAG: WecB/TagA/CpsF family glycosyltransferase [Acidobacteria bacterium]|nr:WecB/TagA/CpsF family glycosyltransferase [Acidobacteriota bacterium]